MKTIYGLISDCGDGSATIHWYRKKENVDYCLDYDNGKEHYWSANDCGPAEELTFPDDFDLEAAGFQFNDKEIESEM